jgi:Thiamine pyrophosphate enzyme, C-terminal TPP binding domain
MTRTEVAMILGRLRKGRALIVGPGLGGRLIAAQGDEPLTVYNMEMAYVTSTALGVALGWPAVKVVAVEGDGSMLMGQAALTSVARYQPPNLIILVFDNGCYLTTGSGTATTATTTGADIEKIGAGAGFKRTATVSAIAETRSALERAFAEPGPWLIVAKIDASDREHAADFVPLPTDCYESGQRFRRAALACGAPSSMSQEPRLV